MPEQSHTVCPNCKGKGYVQRVEDCKFCEGVGTVTIKNNDKPCPCCNDGKVNCICHCVKCDGKGIVKKEQD